MVNRKKIAEAFDEVVNRNNGIHFFIFISSTFTKKILQGIF